MDAKHLKGLPLLADVSKRDLEVLARLADEVDVDAGVGLLSKGAFPHEFFMILTGSVEVRDGDTLLATLGDGEFFGEIALIKNDRRTASVMTSTPCTLAVMTTQGFSEMQHSMPAVALRLHEAALARLPS